MSDLFLNNIALILLLPLWLFLIIMCGRFFAVYVNKVIIYFLTLVGSLVGAVYCSTTLPKITAPIEWTYPFIQINNFTLDFGLRIDKLSLIMGVILFTVSFCVQLFSISHMKEEKKNYRFFAMLNFFNFSMAALLFSPNLFQIFVFWELAGIVSYLLIGFNYDMPEKSSASKRVFLMNRIGDTALISGIIILSYFMYNYAGNLSFTTLSFEDMTAISTLFSAYTSPDIYLGVCILFIIGAMVKSAQFPFYTWLQDAMEASLPVSALLHSATLVALGVYLLARIMPFLVLDTRLMIIIIGIGILTAFICSILAIDETNPKKILAYSTSANLGLMFTALGVQNIRIAIIFFAAHALTKSALFLLLPKEDKKLSYVNFALFIIAALSLTGIGFAGHAAKELLAFQALYKSNICCGILFIFPAIYMTKLCILLYKNSDFTRKINKIEVFSVLLILFSNVILYLILRNTYANTNLYYLYILGIIFGFGAIHLTTKFPNIIEKINYEIVPAIYNQTAKILCFGEDKIFSNYKPILMISKSLVRITEWIEINLMNKSVNTLVKISKKTSDTFMRLQSGNVQIYNAYAFMIITLILSLMIAGYLVIIEKFMS